MLPSLCYQAFSCFEFCSQVAIMMGDWKTWCWFVAQVSVLVLQTYLVYNFGQIIETFYTLISYSGGDIIASGCWGGVNETIVSGT